MTSAGTSVEPKRAWTWLTRRLRRYGISGRTAIILAPTLWLAIFFLAPLMVVLKIALSTFALARPPYAPLLEWTSDGVLQITLHIENFLRPIQDPLFAAAYINSAKIAAVSTLITLAIAYPMAWFIARSDEKHRNLLLMLVILPFWTSFLLRVYAWMGLLGRSG